MKPNKDRLWRWTNTYEILSEDSTLASLPPDANQSQQMWPLHLCILLTYFYLVSVICQWFHCLEDINQLSHHWPLSCFCCGWDPHGFGNIFQRKVVSWWVLDEVEEDLFPTFYRKDEFRMNKNQFSRTLISPAVAYHNRTWNKGGSE